MKVVSLPTSNIVKTTEQEELVMSNTITLNQNSTRSDRSKYLAQCAVSKGRYIITLREARENEKRSTKEAAEAVGITERTLKRWEIDCGRANSLLIGRLCAYYGITMSHVHAGREEDLIEARREASALEKKEIRVEDIILALKQKGHDTSEMESYLQEIRASWEDETKNAPAIGVAKASVQSHM